MLDFDWNNLKRLINFGKNRKGVWLLEDILDKSFQHAVWALGAVVGHNAEKRLYSCFCARRALASVERLRPADFQLLSGLVDLAEKRARGEVGPTVTSAAHRLLEELINPSQPRAHFFQEDGSALLNDEFSTDEMVDEMVDDDGCQRYLRLSALATLREDLAFSPQRAAKMSVSVIKSVAFDQIDAVLTDWRDRLVDQEKIAAQAVREKLTQLALEGIKALTSQPFFFPLDANRIVDSTLASAGLGFREQWAEELIFPLSDFVGEYFREETLADELRLVCRSEGPYADLGRLEPC
ncbi:MAG: hypothetical protein LBR11_12590 [Deltaproteobacteria bacterium]|nr:hypothetical protein [Deltaproteobacteria bacterium]